MFVSGRNGRGRVTAMGGGGACGHLGGRGSPRVLAQDGGSSGGVLPGLPGHDCVSRDCRY